MKRYFIFFIYFICYYVIIINSIIIIIFVDRQLNVVMPGSHLPEHVSRDSRLQKITEDLHENINSDVTNRQADNQLHPVTFPVTYQKVPFP